MLMNDRTSLSSLQFMDKISRTDSFTYEYLDLQVAAVPARRA